MPSEEGDNHKSLHHPTAFVSAWLINCPPHALNCPLSLRSLAASPEKKTQRFGSWTSPTTRSPSVTTRSQRWWESSLWPRDAPLVSACVWMSEIKGGGDEKRGTEESPWRRTEDACEQINRIACYLSRAAPARFWPPAGHLPPHCDGNACLRVGGGDGH